MPLSIRRAVPADAEALEALARGLNEHEGDPVEKFTAQAIRRDLFGAAPQAVALLAELDGAPVGFAMFHDAYYNPAAARGLYLSDLFVAAEARRRGVARALMAAVAAEAKAAGRTFVWWTRKAQNDRAGAFYRTLGAVEEPVVAHALHGEAFDRLK